MGVKFPKAYNDKTGEVMTALEVYELKNKNPKKFSEIKDFFFCENRYRNICEAPMSFVNRKGTVFFRTKPRREHSSECGAIKDTTVDTHLKEEKQTVVKKEEPAPRYLGRTHNTIRLSINRIRLEESFWKLVGKLLGIELATSKQGVTYSSDVKNKGIRKERRFADIDITIKTSRKTGDLKRVSLRQIHASNIVDSHIDEIRFVYGKVEKVEIFKDNKVAVVFNDNVRWVPNEKELEALKRKNHTLYRLLTKEPENIVNKLLIIPAIILPSIPRIKEKLGNKYYLRLLIKIAEFSFIEGQSTHSQTQIRV